MSIRELASGRYQVDVIGADGKRRRRNAKTKKQAEAIQRQMLNDRDDGVIPISRKLTLSEFITETWEPTVRPTVAAQTWIGYETHLRLYIRPLLGDRRLAAIDTPTIQRFVGQVADKGRSPATVRRVYATLSTILHLGADHGLCRPPARATRSRRSGIRLPAEEHREFDTPTAREVLAIVAAADPRYRAAIITAAFCGLRWGELFALRASDVGWDLGTLRVHRVLEQKTGQIVKRTKGKEERTIGVPRIVMDALQAHRAEHKPKRLLFEHDGRPIDASWFHKRIWDPARRAADAKTVRFHDLRHACASILAEEGASAKEVQEFLGHSTPEFTLKQYTHLWPDAGRRTKTRLDQAVDRASEEPSEEGRQAR